MTKIGFVKVVTLNLKVVTSGLIKIISEYPEAATILFWMGIIVGILLFWSGGGNRQLRRENDNFKNKSI